MVATDETADSPPRVPVYRNPFVWAFVIGAALLVAIRPLQNAARSAPEPLARVGEWELLGHAGGAFGAADLRGKVWIANFMFTRCPSVCPELTRKLRDVTERFSAEEGMAFVSFSVDPEFDTPEVLRNYRVKSGIQDPRWTFVTGPLETVHTLLTTKMLQHVGEKEPVDPQSELFDISHVARFALFDQNGDLRAMADTDPAGLARLVSAAKLLLEEGPNP